VSDNRKLSSFYALSLAGIGRPCSFYRTSSESKGPPTSFPFRIHRQKKHTLVSLGPYSGTYVQVYFYSRETHECPWMDWMDWMSCSSPLQPVRWIRFRYGSAAGIGRSWGGGPHPTSVFCMARYMYPSGTAKLGLKNQPIAVSRDLGIHPRKTF
jgi:hypothetical protein